MVHNSFRSSVYLESLATEASDFACASGRTVYAGLLHDAHHGWQPAILSRTFVSKYESYVVTSRCIDEIMHGATFSADFFSQETSHQ